MPHMHPELLLNQMYLCFTNDHDRQAARRAFTLRFGEEPQHVIATAWLLYVGPITLPITELDPAGFDIRGVTLIGPVPAVATPDREPQK